jgi:hypothetical protein
VTLGLGFLNRGSTIYKFSIITWTWTIGKSKPLERKNLPPTAKIFLFRNFNHSEVPFLPLVQMTNDLKKVGWWGTRRGSLIKFPFTTSIAHILCSSPASWYDMGLPNLLVSDVMWWWQQMIQLGITWCHRWTLLTWALMPMQQPSTLWIFMTPHTCARSCRPRNGSFQSTNS